MFRMVSILLVTIFLLLNPARGETPAERMGPLLTDDTVLVGHLDVGQVTLAPLFELGDKVFGEDLQIPPDKRATIGVFFEGLRAQGLKDVFLVYPLTAIPGPPVVLIPGDQAKALPLELVMGFLNSARLERRNLRDFTAFGPARVLDYLAVAKPRANPNLAAAFAVCGESALKLAYLTSPVTERVVREMAPPLPAALGGGDARLLVDELKWVALGVATDEELTTTFRVQATSPEAAKKIERLLRTGFSRLADAEVSGYRQTYREFYPEAFALLEGLLPKTEGDTVATTRKLLPEAAKLATVLRENLGLAARWQSANNLKQIGLGIHNYHDVYGRFPADILDKDGKPLLSWRVAILPFLEQNHLYQQFKLDEPWDSPHNLQLLKTNQIKIYSSPADARALGNKTIYLGVAGDGTVFGTPEMSYAKITDGTSNTVMVLEAANEAAVPWTKPEDLPLRPQELLPKLNQRFRTGFHALFADGSVHFLPKGLDPEMVEALLIINDGKVIRLPR